MLDTATKKRIDDCRDILVGKLPDPKAQIEQITIGLIYKFMDDMDKEAIELGGKAKFFSGPYAKYSWDALFDTKVTAAEMLQLYAEAVESMEKNPNIPQLFRDIFNNAFLPYRDPETLKLFLKTIGEFEYTHSEKLGDAFEYLLSVMGSQGDAGQFRTPRHIIDFLVAVVDPQKNETILDPACGTAGFLISAFKHIKSQNAKGLTPDERKRLIKNFVGYDISPDMVRLSLVNLYLHGFNDPHIHEYDTLSSEERWDESFDVVLANPPFMSPKGGIRPHKRFSIASNRSEVLFVDYIAEHLNPKGRAGIIVPEGVIFQSGTAYKALRKMLVDKYLYAVISLPAGVFNPYSGVKTSILLLDGERAKVTDEILFVKIDNDGYNLGAQRSPVKGGQLQEAIDTLRQYQAGLYTDSPIAHAVPKAKLAENGEYNLSGERYKIQAFTSGQYIFATLADICDVRDGTHDSPKYVNVGYPLITSKNIKNGRIHFEDVNYISQDDLNKINQRSFVDDGDIIMPMIGTIGNPVVVKKDREFAIKNVALIKFYEDSKINNHFLRAILNSDFFKQSYENSSSGSTQKFISLSFIRNLQIPLPPLSVQEEIVAEIEGYQKIIDGAKMVVANYKPQITIHPDWEMVELGEVCEVKSGGTPSRDNESLWNGNIPYIKTGQIDFNRILQAEEYITEKGLNNSSTRLIPAGTILMAMYGQGITRGRVAILEIEAAINQAVAAILPKIDNLIVGFLYLYLESKYEYLRAISDARGGNQSNLSAKLIKELKIPLPPLETQQAIVAQIEAEQVLVNANKQLIALFEQKIKDRIAQVWGDSPAAAQPAPAQHHVA